MKTLNRLTGPQTYQVGKWLEANVGGMARLPLSKVAERASADLGFAVTAANILAAEQATGCTIDRSRGIGQKKRTGDSSRLLARELVRIAKEFGIEPSADVAALAAR